MPAIVVAAAVTAAGAATAQVVGSKMQANASRRAGDIQAHAASDALDFERQQYARAQQEYDGWLHGGEMAKMGDLLKLPPGATPPPTMSAGGSPSFAEAPNASIGQLRMTGPNPMSGQFTPGAAGQGQMVRMQSPTGEVRMVTQQSVNKYLNRGMRVVG